MQLMNQAVMHGPGTSGAHVKGQPRMPGHATRVETAMDLAPTGSGGRWYGRVALMALMATVLVLGVMPGVQAAPDTPAAAPAPGAAAPPAASVPAAAPTTVPPTAKAAAPTAPAVVQSASDPVQLVQSATAVREVVLPKLRMAVEEVPNGVRLGFDWPVSVGAAVFVRGDRLWIVFDQAAQLDAANLTAAFSRWVLSASQFPDPAATVLTVRLAEQLQPLVRRDGTSWVIDLAPVAQPLSQPIGIERESVSTGLPRAILPTVEARSVFRLLDREAGDQIRVIPLSSPGFGIGQMQEFVQFRVLPSAQGIAIIPLADDLAVDAASFGVAVSAPRGLTLSVPQEGSSTIVRVNRRPIANWAAWSSNQGVSPTDRHKALMVATSAEPAGSRNPARMELARFLVGHYMGADALGVLRTIASDDPVVVNDAEYRALRGIADAQLGRYDDASADLAHPALEFDPHAALWRSRIAASRRNWAEAREQYMRGLDVIGAYSPAEQTRFHLATARAAIGLGDLQSARTELAVSYVVPGMAELASGKAFLEGVVAQASADNDRALERYAAAAAFDWRPIRVEAELAHISLALALGKITEEDAVAKLERMRFAWRGDAVERDVTTRLYELYVAREDWRSALVLMRATIATFPNATETPAIRTRLSAVFEDLFSKGGADRLTPLGALALYYDFRELTPLDAAGDEMIRRLADRLTSVDLLDRAAELLDHQVRHRLAGTAKAQVSARLALLYLLDRNPGKALAALDQSEQPQLPEALTAQRKLLRARALADLDRPKDALNLLADDQSVPASELISEIAWKVDAWPLVSATNEALLGTRWQAEAPLSQTERGRVLRAAVAMTLSSDAAGLERLRSNWSQKMEGGAGEDAFKLIVGRVDPRTTAFRDLANSIATVGTLESFMASYRDRIQTAGLSAIN